MDVRTEAEEVNLDRENVQRILRKELNMRLVCAQIGPNFLSEEQKERCKELCLDVLQRIENEPDLFNLIITCDETWVLTYDHETKRQSMQWNSKQSPRPKRHARVFRMSMTC